MSTPAAMWWSMFFLCMSISSGSFRCVSVSEICLGAEGRVFDGVCCDVVDVLGGTASHRAAGGNPGADGRRRSSGPSGDPLPEAQQLRRRGGEHQIRS